MNLIKKSIVPVCILLLTVFMIVHVVYAKIAPTKTSHVSSYPKPTVAEVKSQLEQSLTESIQEYSMFESNMPSSISAADQAVLNEDLPGAISRMQASLATLQNIPATSTAGIPAVTKASHEGNASTSQADSLLSVKMSMLARIFRLTPRTHSNKHVASSSSKISANQTITFSAPLKTTIVSADLVHEIINLNSFSGVQALEQEFIAQILKLPRPEIDSSTATSSIVVVTPTIPDAPADAVPVASVSSTTSVGATTATTTTTIAAPTITSTSTSVSVDVSSTTVDVVPVSTSTIQSVSSPATTSAPTTSVVPASTSTSTSTVTTD